MSTNAAKGGAGTSFFLNGKGTFLVDGATPPTAGRGAMPSLIGDGGKGCFGGGGTLGPASSESSPSSGASSPFKRLVGREPKSRSCDRGRSRFKFTALELMVSGERRGIRARGWCVRCRRNAGPECKVPRFSLCQRQRGPSKSRSPQLPPRRIAGRWISEGLGESKVAVFMATGALD